jgi:hypothetical protein
MNEPNATAIGPRPIQQLSKFAFVESDLQSNAIALQLEMALLCSSLLQCSQGSAESSLSAPLCTHGDLSAHEYMALLYE